MATEKQIHYIECLAIDLGMDRLKRQLAVSRIVKRDIRFLDELKIHEASAVIDDFKEQKDNSDPSCS
jgi:hypothetical protein